MGLGKRTTSGSVVPDFGDVTFQVETSGATRSAGPARNGFRYERGTGLGQGRQPALDAAGIEEHGQPEIVAVPKFLGDFQERQLYRRAVLTEQMDVPPGFATGHRRGKTEVELELVSGQNIGGRVDMLHPGRRRKGRGLRNLEGGVGHHAIRSLEDRAHVQPRRHWKSGTKGERAILDRVPAEQRGHVALAGIDRKQRRPAGGGLHACMPADHAKDAAIQANSGVFGKAGRSQQPQSERDPHDQGSGTVRRSSDAPSPISTRALASSYLSRCCTPLRLAMVSYGTPVTSVCFVMGA